MAGWKTTALGVLDFDAVLAALNPAAAHPPSAIALLILGTAFSFVHLLDFLAENHLRFELPQVRG